MRISLRLSIGRSSPSEEHKYSSHTGITFPRPPPPPMSFRYTNGLIGVMKHRILLERGRRSLLTRVFVGECNGVVVRYSAYGRVLSLDVSPSARSTFVRSAGGNSSEGDVPSSPMTTTEKVDLQLLSTSIRGAVAAANRQLVSAKEELYRQSISGNEQLSNKNRSFRKWFEEDGNSLSPHPTEMVARELGATPWAISVRRDTEEAPLTVADTCRPFQPGMIALEDPRFVLTEQRKEMSEDEQSFWRRVDLIRRSQQSTISGKKRQYKDDVDAAAGGNYKGDGTVDKVALKFVQ